MMGLFYLRLFGYNRGHKETSEEDMRAVIAVIGKDRPGIIAKVSNICFLANSNILDITQTVMQGDVFTMVMLVDVENLQISFGEFKEKLQALAGELGGIEIHVQREEIFSSMHRI